MLATAVERWNLHQRLALAVLVKMGKNPASMIGGFMLATGGLSMWISNTATTIMMLPIAVAVVQQLYPKTTKEAHPFAKALVLGIAYSASIGGIATLIGTPTNVILVGVLSDQYGSSISFAQWMLFAFPVVIILMLFCWYYLVYVCFKIHQLEANAEEAVAQIKAQQAALGPISTEERRVLYVFIAVAIAWISRTWLLNPWLPALNDSMIALTGAISLFIIPASRKKPAEVDVIDPTLDDQDDSPHALLDWETAVNIPWGVILLFGGGLSLANAFAQTGLAAWLGGQIAALQALPLLLLLLLLITGVNFLTEITSNVATVSMILPVLAALATAIGVHPYVLMLGATCAASCAFMLPVATAPNAIVFGSNYLKITDMARVGLVLNLVSIVSFTGYVYWVSPYLFGFELFGGMGE